MLSSFRGSEEGQLRGVRCEETRECPEDRRPQEKSQGTLREIRESEKCNARCENKVGRLSLNKNYEIASMMVSFFQNEEAMERAALLSRDSISCAGKRNLGEIIGTASENNVRLRKKLDLIKYQREKVCSWTFSRAVIADERTDNCTVTTPC